MKKTITTCLAFIHNAEEAVNTYVALFNDVFGDSKILKKTYFSENELEELKKVPEMSENIMPKSGIKTIRFTLAGQEFIALNGGAYFGKFHESLSLYVSCETQEQIDKLWARLSESCLAEQPCGWIKDKYGVSWQIVPSFVWEIDEGDDKEAAERMNIALFDMKKIDIEKLKSLMAKQ
jgi:predicted 3-demethylubiquinone-9 3-methyltransferase (glyoxalase superfamily)